MWPLSIVLLMMIVLTMMVSEHAYQERLQQDRQQVEQRTFLFIGYSDVITAITTKPGSIAYQQMQNIISDKQEWLPFNPIDWCQSELFNQQTCHWGGVMNIDNTGKQTVYFYYRSPGQNQRLTNDIFGKLLTTGIDANVIGFKNGDKLINLQGQIIAPLSKEVTREINDGALVRIINKT